MLFRETCRMEERIRMLADYDAGHWSVSDLCQRYGVSRDTFHAWRARRASGAADWFFDRLQPSHGGGDRRGRSWRCGGDFPIWARASFWRSWRRGTRTRIGRRLRRSATFLSGPGSLNRSSVGVGRSIRRRGRLRPRRPTKNGRPTSRAGFAPTTSSGSIPLTITDGHTRFLIETRITEPTVEGARAVFTRAFRTYGLPLSIRRDNGAPFGSQGAGGLTRLSTWWLKLGVEPHFIRPASPQENGRHGRMHRTLKQQTTRPPAADATEQQGRFDAFRRHYNEERPHEALGQRPPADLYAPSPRRMPERVEDPWYDADHEVRRVRTRGEIKWRGEFAFVSEALVGELVGLAELDNGDHVVRFCGHDLGVIDRRGAFRRFAPPRAGLRQPPERAANSNLSTISPVQNVEHQPG